MTSHAPPCTWGRASQINQAILLHTAWQPSTRTHMLCAYPTLARHAAKRLSLDNVISTIWWRTVRLTQIGSKIHLTKLGQPIGLTDSASSPSFDRFAIWACSSHSFRKIDGISKSHLGQNGPNAILVFLKLMGLDSRFGPRKSWYLQIWLTELSS